MIVLLPVVAVVLGGCAPGPERSALPSLPTPISNNAVASVVRPDGSATVYSFMGIIDPGDTGTITPAAVALDVGARRWRAVAGVPLDQGRARIASSAVTLRGRIFLVGGYSVLPDGDERTDPRLLEYHPATNTWADRGKVPVEVDDTVALAWRERYIYLISGWHGPARDNVRAVQVYDVDTGSWFEATPLPGPGVFGHAGAIADNRIVVIDGVERDPETRAFVISDKVYVGVIDRADPSHIDWERRPAHPGSPTYRAASAPAPTPGGRLLFVGGTAHPYNIDGVGYDGRPARPLDQILVFDPRTLLWTTERLSVFASATMDHRTLAPLGDGTFALVGGMTAPGRTTERVIRIRVAR